MHHLLDLLLILLENFLVECLDAIEEGLLLVDDLASAVVFLRKVSCMIIHLLFVVFLEILNVIVDDGAEFFGLVN